MDLQMIARWDNKKASKKQFWWNGGQTKVDNQMREKKKKGDETIETEDKSLGSLDDEHKRALQVEGAMKGKFFPQIFWPGS